MVLSAHFTVSENNIGLFTFLENDTSLHNLYKKNCVILETNVLSKLIISLNNTDNFKVIINHKTTATTVSLNEYSQSIRPFINKNFDTYGNLVFTNIDSFIKCLIYFMDIKSEQIVFTDIHNKTDQNYYARIPIIKFNTELNISGSKYVNINKSLFQHDNSQHHGKYINTTRDCIEQFINNLTTSRVYFINVEDYLIPYNCTPKIDNPIELIEDEFLNIVIVFEHIGKIITNGVIFKKESSVSYTEELDEESIGELVEESIGELVEESIGELDKESIGELDKESTEQPIEQPIEQLTEQSIEQPIKQSIEQPIKQLTEQPIKQNINNDNDAYTDEYDTHRVLIGVTLISLVIGTMYYFFKKK